MRVFRRNVGFGKNHRHALVVHPANGLRLLIIGAVEGSCQSAWERGSWRATETNQSFRVACRRANWVERTRWSGHSRVTCLSLEGDFTLERIRVCASLADAQTGLNGRVGAGTRV